MFTFINATVLIALAAGIIPLIIHLLNRQRKKNIRFSTIRFLKVLEKQRLKRLKLYQYLLILIRTLIILFLVLAFARPTFTGQNSIGNATRTTAIIVLDDAVYMRRYDEHGNRYYRAQKKAQEILEQFHPDDQVFILYSHAPDMRILDLTNSECSFASADWPGVFTRAGQIFSEYPNYNRELFIISDFQFPEPDPDAKHSLENVRYYLFPIAGENVSNVSIDTVRLENALFEIDNIVQFDAILRNHNFEPATGVECHLYINDKRVAHQRVNLESGEIKPVNLTFQPKSRGLISGYIELSDDDLIADNRYYFSFNIPDQIEVLYVNDTPSLFMDAAWKAVASNSNITITEERYNSWGRHALNSFQTVCLVNPANIAEVMTNNLRQYVENGGGLILIPGLNSLPSDFNRLCKKLNINTQMKELIQARDNISYFTIKQPSLNQPIFSDLFRLSDPEFTRPVFQKYLRFRTLSKELPILAFTNGDPFLFQPNRSVFILASAIDENWTDLQYRGLFIPLFVRLVYLSSATSIQKNIKATVGDETVISFDQVSRNNFELIRPDGTQNRLAPVRFDPQITLLLNQLDSPGHYTLRSGSTHLRTISVNVPSRHIVQNNADFSTLSENVYIFDENAQFSEAVQQARVGLELWKYALMAVLLFIITELFLIKKTEGKN